MRDASPRLGRSLAALLGEPAAIALDSDEPTLRLLPVQGIRPNPQQPREPPTEESLAELADSIRANGVLQPILVRQSADPAIFEIVAGERRWRAARMAGLDKIPCIVRPLSDRLAQAATLVENLQRSDLNAVEEAIGFEQMIEKFSLTQDQIAQVVGKSRSHVANTLRLLALPTPILDHLRAGRLSAGHARALISVPNPEDAAEAVIRDGLSVRETEAFVSRPGLHKSSQQSERPARRLDPNMTAIQQELTLHLGLRVKLHMSGKRGTLSIGFDTLDQLDGVVALLKGRFDDEANAATKE